MAYKNLDVLRLVNYSSQAALLQDITERMKKRSGFSVATLNLDHIVKMRRDSAFQDAYVCHTHIVADGNPIVWLSAISGRKIELIPGSELIIPLVEKAVEVGASIAMLGANAETLDKTAAALADQYPDLIIAERIAPPYGYDPDGDVAAQDLIKIDQSGSALCFLALGAPKQEMLAARAASLAPHCGFVSIGAGLDFIAGDQKRAPVWVRKLALEWLWRMLGNPRRLAKRYWDCIMILPGLAITAYKSRKT